MGSLDVPGGVRLRTGLLVATSRFPTLTSGTAQGIRNAVDIGPGFVIGIVGLQVDGPILDANAESVSFGLALDPSLPLTTFPDQTQLAWFGNSYFRLVTSGGSIFRGAFEYNFPAPLLTVSNFLTFAQITNAADTTLVWHTYYHIYEVTDAEFLRIAGVSLSRG